MTPEKANILAIAHPSRDQLPEVKCSRKDNRK